MKYLQKDGDWYKISFDNVNGAYVSSEFVNITEAQGQVNDNDVNVRSKAASTSSDTVAKVNKGDTVTVTAQDGSWYQIRRGNGDTAYVSKSYVTGELLSEVPTFSGGEEIASQTYAVTGSSLRLRDSASTDGGIITTLSLDEVLDVLEVNGDWVKVKTDAGQTGYKQRICCGAYRRKTFKKRVVKGRFDCSICKTVPRHAVFMGWNEP